MIPLDRLMRGPFIRHQAVPETDDAMLAASIAEAGGALTPILVRVAPAVTGGDGTDGANCAYEIVDGWRRVQAARSAGLAEIEARVVELTDAEVIAAQLAVQATNQGLHPVDAWIAVRDLVAHGMDQRRAARMVGVTTQRDLQVMSLLGQMHPTMLDLCRIEMPTPHQLRVIAAAGPERQAAVAARGYVDGQDVDWFDITRALRVERIPRSRAAFALDDWPNITWQQDLLAQPGADDEWTTEDVELFLTAQQAACKAKADADKRGMVVDTNYNIPAAPRGFRVSWMVDTNRLPKGAKRGYYVISDGKLEVVAVVPAAAADQEDDDNGVVVIEDADGEEVFETVPHKVAPAAEPPPAEDPLRGITAKGLALIRQRKEAALHQALRDWRTRMQTNGWTAEVVAEQMLQAMILAFGGNNVIVRGVPYGSDPAGMAKRIVAADGTCRDDLSLERTLDLAAELLGNVLRMAGDGSISAPTSGVVAEWIGRDVDADRYLPSFDDETMLAECRGALLDTIAQAAGITPKGSVADRRKRLQGQAKDWRPTPAQFGAAGPVGAA